MLGLFGKTFSLSVVNAHLFILTDREIILIRDEDLVKGRPDLRYGGIWSYVPREKITGLSLKAGPSELMVLSLHLPYDQRIDLYYSQELREDLEKLLSQFETSQIGKLEPAGTWN